MSGHHIKQLENDGYCRLPQLFTASEIDESLSLDREWFVRSENSLSDNVTFLNRHHPIVYNLQNTDVRFLDMILATNNSGDPGSFSQ